MATQKILPSFLKNSYQRYKANTDVFAGWLLETNEACKHMDSDNSSIGASTKSKRTKGKELKQAQPISAKTLQDGEGNDTQKPAYRLALEDLQSYAANIAKSRTPPVKIPRDILQAALQAVSARRKSTAWFQENSSESQSNSTHTYFADVLEKALRIVCSQLPDPTPPPRENKTSTNLNKSNYFASLALSDDAEDDAGAKATPTTTSEATRYVLKTPDDSEQVEAEKRFATSCMFDDLNRIEEHVQGEWVAYSAGEIDLITVPLVTNSAIDIARQIVEDLQRVYPDLGDFRSTMHAIMSYRPKSSAHTLPESLTWLIGKHMAGEEKEPGNVEGQPGMMALPEVEFKRWLFVYPAKLLYIFCDFLPSGPLLPFKGYNYEAYRVQVAMLIAGVDVFAEHYNVLRDMLAEISIFDLMDPPLCAQDAFSAGVCAMAKTKVVPVWLAFAAGLFINIHRITTPNTSRGFDELRDVAAHVARNIDKYQSLSAERKPADHEDCDFLVESLSDVLDGWVIEDGLLHAKQKVFDKFSHPKFNPEIEARYLYRHHPLLCGILSSYFLLRLQEAGLDP